MFTGRQLVVHESVWIHVHWWGRCYENLFITQKVEHDMCVNKCLTSTSYHQHVITSKSRIRFVNSFGTRRHIWTWGENQLRLPSDVYIRS